jgi:putative transposase
MAWNRVTDAQWEKIKPHLPVRKKPWRKKDRKGGRPFFDDRKCFEGILWILRTGAPWEALPKEYGASSTLHRRLQRWANDGTLEKLWRAFLAQLEEKDHIRWNECFVDGTFASAKKGGSASEKQSAGRERSLWYWLMARVLRSDFTWRLLPRRR